MSHQILLHWKKQSRSYISYMPGVLWVKVINFKDDSVAECDVPAVKNTSFDDGNDNDDRK